MLKEQVHRALTTMFSGGIEIGENEDEYIRLEWDAESERFFAGITSLAENGIDLRQYSTGYLVLDMEIPRDIGFQVGIIDTDGAENWININPWSFEYGLVRFEGEDRVHIPLSTLANDVVNFEKVRYPFVIRSLDGNPPSGTFELKIDDVFWEAVIE